jgi:hypothetical protein
MRTWRTSVDYITLRGGDDNKQRKYNGQQVDMVSGL